MLVVLAFPKPPVESRLLKKSDDDVQRTGRNHSSYAALS